MNVYALSSLVSFEHDLLKSKRWKDNRGNIIDIVQKMKNHFYFHSAKGYATGQELHHAFFKFFDHIAGIRDDPGYTPQSWETSSKWKSQVQKLRAVVEQHVKVEQLDRLVYGIFTAWIECFYSACILGAPKQKNSAETMRAGMGLVKTNWNLDMI